MWVGLTINGTGGNFCEQKLSVLFNKYGRLVGKYPLFFLLIPLALFAAMVPGLMKAQLNFDLTNSGSRETAAVGGISKTPGFTTVSLMKL